MASPLWLAAVLLAACVGYSTGGVAATFACAPQNNPGDCAGLGALYAATNKGSGWRGAAGWKEAASGLPTDLCTFARVVCDNASGRPVLLALVENGLNGTLPSALGALHTLTSLQVGNNALSGTLPASLASLTSLVELYAVTTRCAAACRRRTARCQASRSWALASTPRWRARCRRATRS